MTLCYPHSSCAVRARIAQSGLMYKQDLFFVLCRMQFFYARSLCGSGSNPTQRPPVETQWISLPRLGGLCAAWRWSRVGRRMLSDCKPLARDSHTLASQRNIRSFLCTFDATRFFTHPLRATRARVAKREIDNCLSNPRTAPLSLRTPTCVDHVP